MKKVLFLLVLLLLAAGAALVVGYLPLRHQSGSISILYSKTSGWHSEPITPGTFSWRWELLIPTNSEIHHFPDEGRVITVRSTTVLPSADTYRPLLAGEPSLAQDVRLRIGYRITPEWIAEMAPRGITPEQLSDQLRFVDDEVTAAALVLVESAVLDQAETDEPIQRDAVTERVGTALQERFGHLMFNAVVVEHLELPDPLLWRLGRQAFEVVQQAREQALAETTGISTIERANQDRLVETLQRYGQVLSEYPVLLEYLEVVANTGRDPLNLENLRGLEALTAP